MVDRKGQQEPGMEYNLLDPVLKIAPGKMGFNSGFGIHSVTPE